MKGRCSDTADMFKRRPGRQMLGDKPMTPAERMRKTRAEIKRQIAEDTPESWQESTCAHVMASHNLQHHHQAAWRRYGELKGFGLGAD